MTDMEDPDAALGRSLRTLVTSMPEFYRIGFVRSPLGVTLVALDPHSGNPIATRDAATVDDLFTGDDAFDRLVCGNWTEPSE